MAIARKYERIRCMAEPLTTDEDDQSFDIITLHGLGGTWNKSWTSSGRFCWLSQALVSKFPSSRVLAIDYPDLLQDLEKWPMDIASLKTELIQERSQSERSNSPIIFVGHSFGGNLLKQIFIETHPSSTSLEQEIQLHGSIRAFIYLGTPHKRISFPDTSALWRTLMADCESTLGGGPLDLEHAISNVSRINNDFHECGGEDLPSLCFYETVQTGVGLRERYIVSKIDATLGSRPVETIPLNSRHSELGKFDSAHDRDFLQFLAGFDRLMTTVKDPDLRNVRVTETRRRPELRILSLDGGGVKGLFTVLVLQRLLEAVAQEEMEEQNHGPKLPCDYFDLIGGTSTGGLLAIMLGRLQMDIPACIRTYKALSQRVFYRFDKIPFVQSALTVAHTFGGYSWYNADSLKDALCKTIGENLSWSERESMIAGGFTVKDLRLAPALEPHKSRCFVCAVPKGQHSAERIRSYRSINKNARDTSTYTIWEAARATSAAPLYFSAIEVQGQTYYDGGLACNNPVVEVIKEARTEFPRSNIRAVVSIGTGFLEVSPPEGYLHRILLSLAELVTNTEERHNEVENDEAYHDVQAGYFRFQGSEKLGKIDLADATKLDEIEDLAQQYLDSKEGKEKIMSCARRLARK